MTPRRLVITADDLGRDPRTDATVLDLLDAGHITATTVLAVTPSAADATAAALRLGITPRLHATLSSEVEIAPWPALSARASMMDDDGGLPVAGNLALAGASVEDVLAELTAQLTWLREQGATVTAVDSHAGTLYGLDGAPWLAPVLHWCATENLAFRLPRDLRPYLGEPPHAIAMQHERAVALADHLGVALPAAMITNPASAVELGSYEALRARMVAALATLPAGTSEVFLHPADGLPGATGRVRAWEARLLRDPMWHDAVALAEVERAAHW